ncbi:MAG: methyltransferase domain-containing protein [Candidatus Paracaedibacteraceae bacterium]|nr:methyltransferase domain-containing protein [Candidatus Paracaedibacteraceae bacterium]
MTHEKFNCAYDSKLRSHENKLFFKQWVQNPARLGTLAPISLRLARDAALNVPLLETEEQYVVEIGAGTGRLTRALLERGVPPAQLAAIELDTKLCAFLTETLPAVCPQSTPPLVVEGDATYLEELIPSHWVGKVDTVVSAIPFMYLPEEKRIAIIESAFKVLKPGGKIIHITYNPKSPIAFSRAYHQTRVVSLWINMPPGFVWAYTK